MKFHSKQSLKLFTLTDYPQFYGLGMSLSNILMIGLFRSNNRIVNFSKTEKKIISLQTHKGPYIYDLHIEGGCPHRWAVLKFVTCLQILLFLNKKSIVHFCRWRGGGAKLVIFCDRHICRTPKWFKITTNSIIRGSSFFFNIKPQARCILTA